jgi:hypothetical protein
MKKILMLLQIFGYLSLHGQQYPNGTATIPAVSNYQANKWYYTQVATEDSLRIPSPSAVPNSVYHLDLRAFQSGTVNNYVRLNMSVKYMADTNSASFVAMNFLYSYNDNYLYSNGTEWRYYSGTQTPFLVRNLLSNTSSTIECNATLDNSNINKRYVVTRGFESFTLPTGVEYNGLVLHFANHGTRQLKITPPVRNGRGERSLLTFEEGGNTFSVLYLYPEWVITK